MKGWFSVSLISQTPFHFQLVLTTGGWISSILRVKNSGLVCNQEYYHIIYNYICSLITLHLLHLALLQSSSSQLISSLQLIFSDDEEVIIHWRCLKSELVLIKVMISLASSED